MTLIDEFIDVLKGERRNALKLGELAYRFDETPDSDYGQLRTALTEQGVDAPEKATLSRHKRVHEFWVVNHQYPPERLEVIAHSKLYMLVPFLERTGGDPEPWLVRCATCTRDEIKTAIDDQPLEEPRRSVSAPSSVMERFEEGAQRLYSVNAYEAKSLVPAIEFAAVLLSELPVETLQDLWREAHGEEVAP